MEFSESKDLILNELNNVLDRVPNEQINELISLLKSSDKVFFVGVGRVRLSLEAIAKRFAHLGINCVIVGEITEPAITDKDTLIVGSGSGESVYPISIAKKAKQFGAKVVHIGSNPDSSMKEFTDLMVRIPTNTKLYLDDEISSNQPMTSLFEQSLLILGDAIAVQIVRNDNLDLKNLWNYHANLE